MNTFTDAIARLKAHGYTDAQALDIVRRHAALDVEDGEVEGADQSIWTFISELDEKREKGEMGE